MREILFRGKRLRDGTWVYGNLFVDEKKDKHEILCGYTNYRVAWEVDPETVGQFTGLTDKNGVKIFEGDILNWYTDYNDLDEDADDYNEACLVEGRETVVYGVHNCGCCHAVYGFATEARGKHGLSLRNPDLCIVVGNIYDNPELLEEEQG